MAMWQPRFDIQQLAPDRDHVIDGVLAAFGRNENAAVPSCLH